MAKTPKADSRDYAGFGPTDGVQSEASTSEAERLLEYGGGQSADFNVRSTGWKGGARYTRDYNKA